jgi:hypothetical protein
MPESATACNCTACRRFGALWAYGLEGEGIDVSGPTHTYTRGRWVVFHFCPTCACVAYWRGLERTKKGPHRMGVNLRLADPERVAEIPMVRHDGLETADDLARDGRCVADYWF